MTVAVVGAGLAGLSAAWEVNQAGVEVVVLDAARRPGGMIVTERREGFIAEGGPDGFLAYGQGGGWSRSPRGRPPSYWGFRQTRT